MQEPRATPCEAMRKWPALEPWCEFLRMTTRIRLKMDGHDQLMVGVRLHPRQYWRTLSPNELVLLCREALELLAMLAVVDTPSWQQLLRHRCGCQKHTFWDDWVLPPRFWLKLGDSKSPSDALTTEYYRVFFCGFDASSPKRAKFRAAAAKIESAMTPEMRSKLLHFRSFPVYVRCIPPRGIKADDTVAFLEGVVEMAEEAVVARKQVAAAALPARKPAVNARLVLNGIDVHTKRLTLVPGATQVVAKLTKLSIPDVGLYEGIDIGFDTVVGHISAAECEPLLTAFVDRSPPALTGAAGEASPSFNSVSIGNSNRCVTVEANCALTQRWKAVCSAIGVAQPAYDIYELNIQNIIRGIGRGTRAKRYQWLTYALFSKESRTSVTKLALCDVDFYQEDVNSILSILNARNPASKLGGFTRTSRDAQMLAGEPLGLADNGANGAEDESEVSEAESSISDVGSDDEAESSIGDVGSDDEAAVAAIEARMQARLNGTFDQIWMARVHGFADGGVADGGVVDGDADRGGEENEVAADGDGGNDNADSALEAVINDDGADGVAAPGRQPTVVVVDDDANGGALRDDADGNGATNSDESESEADDEMVDEMDDALEAAIIQEHLALGANHGVQFGAEVLTEDEEEDEFDPEDNPGIEDEDPDVRAYYAEDSEGTGEQAEDFGSVVLKKGTTVQINHFSASDEQVESESLVLEESSAFRVIANESSSDVVSIIVPGFGTCTVQRGSIDHFEHVPEDKTPSSISLGYNGSITSLCLSYLTGVDAGIFLPLLKFLGTKLLSLQLDKEVYLTAASLDQVLAACPHLTSLQYCAAYRSLERALVTAYAENRCRASKLHFGNIRPSQATIDFIRALQDPETAIAQTLEKLSMLHDRGSLFGNAVLTALVEMLKENIVLDFLEIDIYPEEARVFKPQLLAFHGQILPGVRAPLSLTSRLAFLSALKIHRRGHTKPDEPSDSKRARLYRGVDLERIDRGVISLIFLFAAERRARRIRVRVPEDDRNQFFYQRYIEDQVDSDDESVAGA